MSVSLYTFAEMVRKLREHQTNGWEWQALDERVRHYLGDVSPSWFTKLVEDVFAYQDSRGTVGTSELERELDEAVLVVINSPTLKTAKKPEPKPDPAPYEEKSQSANRAFVASMMRQRQEHEARLEAADAILDELTDDEFEALRARCVDAEPTIVGKGAIAGAKRESVMARIILGARLQEEIRKGLFGKELPI